LQQATSSPLGGNFFIEYKGFTSAPLSPSFSSASQVEAAIEKIASTDVSVTRMSSEIDGDVSWLVTFLTLDGTIPKFVILPSNLTGTRSAQTLPPLGKVVT
jgi:hypothetical protein